MKGYGLIKESIRSGIAASLVMMPFGYLFKSLGLRIGHYGPKVAGLLFTEPSPLVLFIQHLVLGILSAIPLLLFFAACRGLKHPVVLGGLYGVGYYLALNSLALPLFFAEPTPWQLGFDFIYPSLLVHIVYGATIGFTARRLLVA